MVKQLVKQQNELQNLSSCKRSAYTSSSSIKKLKLPRNKVFDPVSRVGLCSVAKSSLVG
ncbi:hypothetical protein HanRHA438_Chr10g0448641 [Helianthus annuus]|nr:hypothetical protein HanRHA438_Chr10g0448641 [Helianthus annuus]